MKYLLLLAFVGIAMIGCKNNEPNNDPDYGLLILQKRMDSLETRVKALDSSLRTANYQKKAP